MLVRNGYDNHHCHNKPPDRKWGWSVNDVMPRRDGPENLRILKRVSWDWTIEAELGLLTLRRVVKICRSLTTEILNTTSYVARWGWGQHSKNCVSLLVTPMDRRKKIIDPFVSGITVSAGVLYLCMYCITVVIDLITVYNIMRKSWCST